MKVAAQPHVHQKQMLTRRRTFETPVVLDPDCDGFGMHEPDITHSDPPKHNLQAFKIAKGQCTPGCATLE